MVALVSIVQFLVLVPLNTTSSAEVGAVSPLQFAASDQLFVEPPPSQVRVAASALDESRRLAAKRNKPHLLAARR
jgi:hypothetical protein